MRKLTIELGKHSYAIQIEDDILFHLSFYIKKIYKNKKIFIITDDMVAPLYLDTVTEDLKKYYEVESIILPHGEQTKSIEIYSSTISKLLDKNIKRNELLVALGGGVIGDLTGFIAATLYRGLPYVGVPTTLLSQMDSSIGGKTGIDFYQRKNILGCFKQPRLVLIDPKALDTLSKEEFSNGMGELIKHAIIGNPSLFQALSSKPKIDENIIYESLTVKKRVVELDEFDQKERMLLNFGHTFGHSIELEQGLKHGQAVALGMLMAIQMGVDFGLTNLNVYDEVVHILKLYDLPTKLLNYKAYFNQVIYDKKNLAGTLQFVLVKDIGEAFLYPIAEDKIKELLSNEGHHSS